jgi:hypothetical protein
METKKIKVSGEHFIEVLDRVVNKFNGSMDLQLKALGGQRPKMTPALKMFRENRIKRDLILVEMKKLQNKESLLPAGERQVYSAIISEAIKQTAAEQAAKEAEEANKEKKA